MAYACVSGQYNNNPGQACSCVQRFSNSHLKHEGRLIGNNRSNCARDINSKLSIVASCFPGKTEEELDILKSSETDQERLEMNSTSTPSCKERLSPCNSDNLYCSRNCKWKRYE